MLLQTKIKPLATRTGIAQRPRLLEQVEQFTVTPLTLVQAPAGYGKTTLLQQIARALADIGVPVAWLSLDESENDPTLALSYLCAAFGVLDESINELMAPWLDRAASSDGREVVTALINTLDEREFKAVLILDDLHEVTNPSVHQHLLFLIENLPPSIRCIVSSRQAPPWSFDKLQRGGEVAVLDSGRIRFTAEETRHFLVDVHGFAIDDRGIAVITERTEGWITAIQLVASSLKESEPGVGPEELISGSHRALFDYLVDAVLARQSKETLAFLLRTALLDRMTASLCEAITRAPGAQRQLERLERENLFLIPLDNERTWFRYHSLFREFLRARLSRDNSYDQNAIHCAASNWFEQHNFSVEAMKHALCANDLGRVVGLLDTAARRTVRLSQLSLLLGWIEQLPDEYLLQTKINAIIAIVWGLICARRVRQAQALMEKSQRSLLGRAAGRDEEDVLADKASLELADLAIQRLKNPQWSEAKRVYRIQEYIKPEWHLVRALAELELGHIRLTKNDLDQAYAAFHEACSQADVAHYSSVGVEAMSMMAMIRVQQGRLEDSQRLCKEIGDLFLDETNSPIPAVGFAFLTLAEIQYERNVLDVASEYVERARSLIRQRNEPEFLIRAEMLVANVANIGCEPRPCLERLSRLERAAAQEGVPGMISLIRAREVWYLCDSGELDTAELMLTQLNVPVDIPGPRANLQLNHIDEQLYLALANYHLARGNPAVASRWLKHLLSYALRVGRQVYRARVMGLLAVAYLEQGRRDDALRCIRGMLQLAAEMGLVRSIVELGNAVLELVAEYTRIRVSQREEGAIVAYAKQLVSCASADRGQGGGARFRHAPSQGSGCDALLLKPLTPREHEVLGLINAGMRNKEIADELLIAETSVKWHAKNLFSKLGASRRTQAIAKARALKLIH